MATDLAIGQWAFLHALQVTRTHDVHCHCKTYVALFSTHLTEISTWILSDCTKTNEKFYLRSTQCIQGRKWKKICQVGSNKHENFTWFTMLAVGITWNSLKNDCFNKIWIHEKYWSRRTPVGLAPHPRGGQNRGQSAQLLKITQFLKVAFNIWGTAETLPKLD